jgi:hypothetical protein
LQLYPPEERLFEEAFPISANIFLNWKLFPSFLHLNQLNPSFLNFLENIFLVVTSKVS